MKRKNRPDAAGAAASSGSPTKLKRSLQKAVKAFRKRGALVLAVFLILFAALCSFHYIRNSQTASTILSLDYEEASKGLTPNGLRFNIFEIRSGEVMERLIGYAGLEGKITQDELSECVSVKATHDKNISGNVNYLSTSFVVRFTDKAKIDRISAEDMLSLLCKAYREYFLEHYGFNHSILSFDINDLKFNDEYLMAADMLISTHVQPVAPDLMGYYHLREIGIHPRGKEIFLQHGIIKDEMKWMRYPALEVDFFASGGKLEYDYLVSEFGFPEGVIQYTGLCRFDNLIRGNNPSNEILVMPTWRGSDYPQGDQFYETAFYRQFQSMMDNPSLLRSLRSGI